MEFSNLQFTGKAEFTPTPPAISGSIVAPHRHGAPAQQKNGQASGPDHQRLVPREIKSHSQQPFAKHKHNEDRDEPNFEGKTKVMLRGYQSRTTHSFMPPGLESG